jgi:hypothetical protein
MNIHHTKYRGDLSVAKVAADLVEKRWFVLTPLYSEHLPFDLLSYQQKDKKVKFRRIQVKANPIFTNKTVWNNKTEKSVFKETYTKDTIDYFACWIEQVDTVIYVPVWMVEGNKTIEIRYELMNTVHPFFWYEDFLYPSKKKRDRRRIKDFGYHYDVISDKRLDAIKNGVYKKDCCLSRFKITVGRLQKLLWKYPMTILSEKFGCSDVAIRKIAHKKNCIFPPRGYHIASDSNKRRIRLRYKHSVSLILSNNELI